MSYYRPHPITGRAPVQSATPPKTGDWTMTPPPEVAAGEEAVLIGGLWIVLPTATAEALGQAKLQRIDQLQQERERRIQSGFTWDGSRFLSDALYSQPRMFAINEEADTADYPAEGQPWRLADGSWRTLSAIEARHVWKAFKAHMRAHFDAFAAHEHAIKRLATVNAVQGYNLTQGWPS